MFPINDPHSHLGIITYRNTKLCIHLHLLLSNYSPSASSSSRLMVQPKAVSSDAPREADSHHHPSLLSAVLKPLLSLSQIHLPHSHQCFPWLLMRFSIQLSTACPLTSSSRLHFVNHVSPSTSVITLPVHWNEDNYRYSDPIIRS